MMQISTSDKMNELDTLISDLNQICSSNSNDECGELAKKFLFSWKEYIKHKEYDGFAEKTLFSCVRYNSVNALKDVLWRNLKGGKASSLLKKISEGKLFKGEPDPCGEDGRLYIFLGLFASCLNEYDVASGVFKDIVNFLSMQLPQNNKFNNEEYFEKFFLSRLNYSMISTKKQKIEIDKSNTKLKSFFGAQRSFFTQKKDKDDAVKKLDFLLSLFPQKEKKTQKKESPNQENAKDVEKLKSEVEKAKNKINSLEKDYAGILALYNERKKELNDEIDGLKSERNNLQVSFDKRKAENEKLNAQIKKLEEQNNSLTTENQSLSKQVSSLNETLQMIKNEKDGSYERKMKSICSRISSYYHQFYEYKDDDLSIEKCIVFQNWLDNIFRILVKENGLDLNQN